jgi:ppGpp synthetase/RelA/SpoT-type nucleotidyltranferase
MAAVQGRLSQEVSIETTSRLKTRDTLVDKLRRQRTRLSTVQDIAGLRVVADMSLQEQDAMRTRIESLFPGCAVQDRRVAPSFGYRAVHVIALQDGYRVEIQVRTYLQDLWAQVIERLADAWGRGIRYGEGPEDLEAVEGGLTRAVIVSRLIDASDSIRWVEELEPEIEVARARLDEARAGPSGLRLSRALTQSRIRRLSRGLGSNGEEARGHRAGDA